MRTVIYFIIFYLKNEVDDSILKTIQGLHVEFKDYTKELS